MHGARGAAGPRQGSGGLEVHQEQQGVWGAAAPQCKQFVHGKCFREKVEPITTLLDKVFERPGLITVTRQQLQ